MSGVFDPNVFDPNVFNTGGSFNPPVPPTPTLRVDWYRNNPASFAPAICTLRPLPGTQLLTGRSQDFGSDAPGQLTFSLDNSDNAYTADRQWCDNPSFESGATTGWSVLASGLTAAATSLTDIIDNAPNAGTHAGQVVMPATPNAGCYYALAPRFRATRTYTAQIWMRSVSGSTSVQFGVGSTGTPYDVAVGAGTITTSWAVYTVTWTPIYDRTDAILFVRVSSAAAATVNIDACQVNPGSTANTYLEAPTRTQLIGGGQPCHLYATYNSLTYPLFFGYIQRITPAPDKKTVEVVVYDVLAEMGNRDAIVPAVSLIGRTARDFRVDALNEYERGNINLAVNPEFAVPPTTDWWLSNTFNTTFLRVADAPAGVGVASGYCAEFVTNQPTYTVAYSCYLQPFFNNTQVYRVSVFLRSLLGPQSWTMTLSHAGDTTPNSRTIYVGTDWERYTLTYTVNNTTAVTPAAAPLMLTFTALGAGSLRITGLQITKGEPQWPYSATGIGRWQNFCLAGSFDSGVLSGWYDAFANMLANGSFESGLGSWTAGTDSFVSTAATFSQVGSGGRFGVAYANVVSGSGVRGVYNAVSGTFYAGVVYDISFWEKTGAASAHVVGIGSNGTPADTASLSWSTTDGTWTRRHVTWTPTANRSDVHLYVTTTPDTLSIDGVMVARVDFSQPSGVGPYWYSDTGPCGGIGTFTASYGNSMSTVSTPVKWGSGAAAIRTQAAAGSGRCYDFNFAGIVLPIGGTYYGSVWITCDSGVANVRVGLGRNNGNGGWDETYTNGTVSAGTWTQFALQWTPTTNMPGYNAGTGTITPTPYDMVLTVMQTDATARTLYIDGARVAPNAGDQTFELAQWNLSAGAGESANQYALSTAALQGTVRACLQQLNGITLTRHFIVPLMASPWYQYTTQDYTKPLSVVETYNTNLAIDAQGGAATITGLMHDRDAVQNVLAVQWASGTEYYADPVSIGQYGAHPIATTIQGSAFFSSRTIPDLLGAYFLARFSQPRLRPVMTVTNRWPSQLQRLPNDAVAVVVDAWLIHLLLCTIERITTTINVNSWTTQYQLEETLYADTSTQPTGVGDLARMIPE